MGKKTGIFEEGQHVFARIRGHPFWPACVSKAEVHYQPETAKNNFMCTTM